MNYFSNWMPLQPRKDSKYARDIRVPGTRVNIPSSKIKEGYRYFVCHNRGNCMDSPDSPLRVYDNSYLLIRAIGRNLKTLRNFIGQVVVMDTQMGAYTKCLTSVNLSKQTVSITMYRPGRVTFTIPIALVKEVFLVDDVMSESWVRENSIREDYTPEEANSWLESYKLI